MANRQGLTRLQWIRFFTIRALIGLLFRAFTRMEVRGLASVPPNGPLILASNHLTYLDGPLILVRTPRRVRAMAAAKYRGHPIGYLLAAMGAIFVHRGRPDRQALRKATTVLQAGGALGIAIEGTRSKSGKLNQGKNGVAWLANRANAAVVPVAVHGTERVWTSLRRMRRPTIHLKYGEAIYLPGEALVGAELEPWTERIMRAVADMLPHEYRGVYEKAPHSEGTGDVSVP